MEFISFKTFLLVARQVLHDREKIKSSGNQIVSHTVLLHTSNSRWQVLRTWTNCTFISIELKPIWFSVLLATQFSSPERAMRPLGLLYLQYFLYSFRICFYKIFSTLKERQNFSKQTKLIFTPDSWSMSQKRKRQVLLHLSMFTKSCRQMSCLILSTIRVNPSPYNYC